MNMKTVEHQYKVYVGDYDDNIMLHPVCAPPSIMNPRDFYNYANQLRCDVYSNNMDFVRFYKPENVIVVKKVKTPAGSKLFSLNLTKHPKFSIWEAEMDSGELTSLFGFDWILEAVREST